MKKLFLCCALLIGLQAIAFSQKDNLYLGTGKFADPNNLLFLDSKALPTAPNQFPASSADQFFQKGKNQMDSIPGLQDLLKRQPIEGENSLVIPEVIFNMPIKELDIASQMPIYVPDTSINYTLLIKEFGKKPH